MKSISRMLGLALVLATTAGCDPSNWCLHPFTSSCSSGSPPESGSQGATGVNVLDCMVGDNANFPGRAYTVWGTNGTGWKNFGDVDTIATGQLCSGAQPAGVSPPQGNALSINFYATLGGGTWTIRLVKQRISDPDGCSSSDMTGCSAANDDYQDFLFTADDGSPMATIEKSEDF